MLILEKIFKTNHKENKLKKKKPPNNIQQIIRGNL